MKNYRKTMYMMTIPAVILFFIFHTFPFLQGVFYSFTNWNGLNKSFDLVGLKNYLNLFKDSNVLSSYLFTFKFAIISTILVNIISLLVAIGLNSRIKFKNFFRAIYFLPNVLGTLIVGYIFNYFFANILPTWGTTLQIPFLENNILGSIELAWIGIIVVAVWQGCAMNIILYLSGLQTVPEELYEASAIDGANTWQNFWKITFPSIAPFFTINMVLSLKNFLQVFDQIIALTGGGPAKSTESIAFLIYNGGFKGGEMAYQSANSVVYFIVITSISLFQLKILQRREGDGA